MILPEINLGFLDGLSIMPFHIHSEMVHFAITLPIIILLLEIINLIAKKRVIDFINLGMIILFIASLLGSYLSGMMDANDIIASQDTLNAINKHKVIGIYILIFISLFVLAFKTISMIANKILYTILYIMILLLAIFVIGLESKSGSDLVNKYGINVPKVNELTTIYKDMNMTIQSQNKIIVDMNKTIEQMKIKELNATNAAKSILDINITDINQSIILQPINPNIKP